ncbi:MAG: DUF354 domain-containing protein [Thermoplasmata archaeon]|nr:DUF354 domain-containing protein [Thermoplasmata archaeon]
MSRVIIDIIHPADVNFFKNTIQILKKSDVEIEVIMRSRGNLQAILESELGIAPTIVGRHQSKFLSKCIHIVKRDYDLLKYLKKINFDVVTGFGSFYIAHAAQILNKPSLIFHDDFEYRSSYALSKFSSSKFIIPSSIKDNGKNVITFNGFKELAYLHPRYFQPKIESLSNFGLKPQSYIFVREVGKVSLNVAKHFLPLPILLKVLKEYGLKIVLSIENKALLKHIDCRDIVLLKEPLDDIFSLIHYASLLISSGDTMAREGCLVGTPSINISGRNMEVNADLLKKRFMYQCNTRSEISRTIDYILENNINLRMAKEVMDCIKNDWSDITEIIVKNILKTL